MYLGFRYEEDVKYIKSLSGNFKLRDHVEVQSVDGMMMLKLVLEKYRLRMWTEF
jgi:hypothetical protein